MSKPTYISAYDKKLGRRTIHVLRDNKAVSTITGSSFKFTKKDLEKMREDKRKEKRKEHIHYLKVLKANYACWQVEYREALDFAIEEVTSK